MASIVLKEDVVVCFDGRLQEVLYRIFVPDNVHVLKEEVVTEHRDHLNAHNLGEHHGHKGAVAVFFGGLKWGGTKVLQGRRRGKGGSGDLRGEDRGSSRLGSATATSIIKLRKYVRGGRSTRSTRDFGRGPWSPRR